MIDFVTDTFWCNMLIWSFFIIHCIFLGEKLLYEPVCPSHTQFFKTMIKYTLANTNDFFIKFIPVSCVLSQIKIVYGLWGMIYVFVVTLIVFLLSLSLSLSHSLALFRFVKVSCFSRQLVFIFCFKYIRKYFLSPFQELSI